MTRKTFMGIRLRRLRAERGMSQLALAQALELSPSYLNQLEQNRRPLTVPVLLKISRVLGVDVQQFSEDQEARLIAALQDVLVDAPEAVSLPELQELVTQMPAVAHALLDLQRKKQALQERIEAMALQMGDDRSEAAMAPRVMPFDRVRDFFFANQNYFDGLDRAAEALAEESGIRGAHPALAGWLTQRLERQHGVRVVHSDDAEGLKRRYDAGTRALYISAALEPGQQAFQLGTQLALLELGGTIDALIDVPPFTDDEAARRLARIGLANYVAGALLLPYGEFLQAAETLRYDIDLLGQRFGVGFETVCHRLSTLQRLGAPGVPFFFIRVDRAGNISKRQSATHFHFSRTGGTCPLWNVYEAFGQPGRILPQLARMPDGRTYLWIARTVSRGRHGYGSPRKTFSIGLGCDIRHAHRLVYAKGLELNDPAMATPIGMGCKVCEREHCPQRAFPFVGKPLGIDENHSRFVPYGSG